jgi:4-hydroxy-tetrahydrodipicolinate synthase
VFTLPLLAIGGVGIVSVAAHWCGRQIGEMVSAFKAGDVGRARTINASILDAVAFQTSDESPNPVPAKAMLRELGLPAGHCRLPHVETSDARLAARARAIIDELGLRVG